MGSPLLASQSGVADMARFLAATDPPGKLWNEFELGGALVWALYPRHIYIDGRGDLHARAGTFHEYLEISDTAPGYEQLLERRGCDLVVAHADSRLATRLRKRGWRVAHRSPTLQGTLELLVRPNSPADRALPQCTAQAGGLFRKSFDPGHHSLSGSLCVACVAPAKDIRLSGPT